MKNKYHESVLVGEVIKNLHIKKGQKYIDATAGNGGHIIEILSHGGKVLGIDLDPEMVKISVGRVHDKAKIVQGNFVNIDSIARENGFSEVSGILFDLGVSNIHLKDLSRGFSFENGDAELDMRINPLAQGVKAKDLLNVLREDQLRDLFEVTLDPGSAKWLTGRISNLRKERPIKTVGDMLEICQGLRTGKVSLNEATLPFLALRIAVNSELDNLKEALPKAINLLGSHGRLVVISFHSKEDEIVKNFFKEKSLAGEVRQITFKPIGASAGELAENRRARSAKMRIIEKI